MNIILQCELSKSAQAKYKRLRRNPGHLQLMPVYAIRSGRGYYLFTPPEFGTADWPVAKERLANTPGVARVI